jgi:hypothetical protein
MALEGEERKFLLIRICLVTVGHDRQGAHPKWCIFSQGLNENESKWITIKYVGVAFTCFSETVIQL